jgi:acetyl-CoA carboxylase biotin carboxyl carrier protein
MKASEIRELVKIVEQSDINELEVSRWGQKVRIIKGVPSNGTTSTVTVQAAPAVAPPPPVQQTPAPAPQPTPAEATAPAPATEPPKKENLIEIRSPMVGTFYRAPAPDADPYVKIGDHVEPGTILCIIEAMKLMNEIESEVSGKIVDILVENGKPVEYNQLLFLVEPD